MTKKERQQLKELLIVEIKCIIKKLQQAKTKFKILEENSIVGDLIKFYKKDVKTCGVILNLSFEELINFRNKLYFLLNKINTFNLRKV